MSRICSWIAKERCKKERVISTRQGKTLQFSRHTTRTNSASDKSQGKRTTYTHPLSLSHFLSLSHTHTHKHIFFWTSRARPHRSCALTAAATDFLVVEPTRRPVPSLSFLSILTMVQIKWYSILQLPSKLNYLTTFKALLANTSTIWL